MRKQVKYFIKQVYPCINSFKSSLPSVSEVSGCRLWGYDAPIQSDAISKECHGKDRGKGGYMQI